MFKTDDEMEPKSATHANGVVEEANALYNKEDPKGHSPAPMEDNCCRDKQTKTQSNMKASRDRRARFRRLYNNICLSKSCRYRTYNQIRQGYYK